MKKSNLILLSIIFISLVFSLGIYIRAYSAKNNVKKPSETMLEQPKGSGLNTLKQGENTAQLSVKYNSTEKTISIFLTSPSPIGDGEVVFSYPKVIKYSSLVSFTDYFQTVKPVETSLGGSNVLRVGFLGAISTNKNESGVNNMLIAKLKFSSFPTNSIQLMKDKTQFFDTKGDQVELNIL